MLTLRNRHLSVEVDELQGAEIRAVRTADDRNALAWYDWDCPTPVGRGASYGDAEQDWLSAYRGGWQETVPDAGLVCAVDGVAMGFHGDASRSRWEVVDAGADWCHLRCPTRLPITVDRWMHLSGERPALLLDGRATNLADRDVEIVWGQHPAFPSVPGSRLDLPPGCRVEHDATRPSDLRQEPTKWPNALSTDGSAVDLSIQPDAGTHRLLYLIGHTQGWAALRQPLPHVGVAMAWDVAVHPYMWLWTLRDTGEFPWYGRASVVTLEAQSAWPYDGLAGAVQRGQAIRVPARGSVSTWYTMALLPADTAPVTHVERDGTVRAIPAGREA